MGVGHVRGHTPCLSCGTGEDGEHLIGGTHIVLVPGEDQQTLIDGAGRRVENSRHVAAQPFISRTYRTIMHVIAQVRSDEGKVRCGGCGAEIRGEVSIGHIVTGAASRVVADVVEVEEGVVLGSILAGGGEKAGRGHGFHVGFPGQSFGFEVIGEVRGVDMAGGRGDAVGGDAEVIPAIELQVVGQAGVDGGVVVCGPPEAVAEAGDVG